MYKFRSQAAADLILLGPTGDRVLTLLGREPSPRGILEVADMPAALQALEAAVRADDALRAARAQAQAADDVPDERADEPLEPVSLRQRVWPLVAMLKTCMAADQPVVWGV